MGALAGVVAVAVAFSAFLVHLRREMASIGAQAALAFVIVALVTLLGPLPRARRRLLGAGPGGRGTSRLCLRGAQSRRHRLHRLHRSRAQP